MHDKDFRQRFLFDQFPVRGELVHLNQSWQEITKRHNYPAPIQKLLGEMAAASVLLAATLKFNGSLHMQIRGNGPLSLAVIEATSEQTIRGLAHWDGAVEGKSFPELVSNAFLVVTIEHGVGNRYQGIVDLDYSGLSQALENYMKRSQQIDTRIWLASDDLQSSGMILQKMPERGGNISPDFDSDDWFRVTQLADTVHSNELSELAFDELLHRLFNEEDVRVFDKLPVSFRCSCNRERVRGVLKMLGYDEVSELLQAEQQVNVHCEFCNHEYKFDSVDVEEVFAIDVSAQSNDTMH